MTRSSTGKTLEERSAYRRERIAEQERSGMSVAIAFARRRESLETACSYSMRTRAIRDTKKLPFGGAIYNSVGVGPDGRIWGLAANGVFAIDTSTYDATLVANAPRTITGGFAMDASAIYYISKASVCRYNLPAH